MKAIEKILSEGRIIVKNRDHEGFCGTLVLPGFNGSVICSWGAGWEHVSVANFKRNKLPTWEDMCRIKDLFWKEDEAVIQIHPPKKEYVNNLSNCLHLWRCSYKDMVLPPSVLVGRRPGQTYSELEREIKEAYKMAENKE